ncbi:MAG: hypothetical protein BJ554DRAFT_2204 [Olpidium bornovanus]|uniref:PHD-type domain-containing protein n=1 Tax=Olpidium bornovanus TaxID=278681 RepID=A0A8H7ZRE9_9FUNG|nr:MAG: hypothetical protein BJ554DRAFT_2204 [Olpidium bornovanus]
MEATKPSVPFLLIDSADDVCYAGDICICGSRGRARTDRLVFCSQCGEAYHEYCAAGITVDEVFFDKALCADAVADAAREDAAAPAPVGPPSGAAAAAAAAAAAGPTGGPLHAPAGRRLSIAKPSSWRCFNCLFCELCQEAEPECDLLVCDKCERGFHIQCVSPSLESVPKGRYLCEDCAQCTMCGSRAPGTTAKAVWKRNYELCSTCYGRERRKRQADNKAKLAECGEDEPSPKKCKRAKKVTSASGIFPAPRDSPDAEDAAAAAEEDLPEAAWGAEHREVGIRRSESDGKRRAQGRPKKKSARRTIRTSPAGTAALPKSPSPESPATALSRAPPDAASGRELSVESGTAGVSTASTSTAGSESAKVELAGRQLEMDSEADVRYRQHETAPASAPQGWVLCCGFPVIVDWRVVG